MIGGKTIAGDFGRINEGWTIQNDLLMRLKLKLRWIPVSVRHDPQGSWTIAAAPQTAKSCHGLYERATEAGIGNLVIIKPSKPSEGVAGA